MIELGNRSILDDGTVICTEEAAIEMLYQGMSLDDIFIWPSNDVALFNTANQMLDTGLPTLVTVTGSQYTDLDWYQMWLTPVEYEQFDVKMYCLSMCKTQEEIARVEHEMMLFEERNMLPVLRHLIFMVADFRDRGVMWGVGRGSSVSSFVLHLIGINRINPLEFGLDVREFLK